MEQFLDAVNALRDAIAKYCAIIHNKPVDVTEHFVVECHDDRVMFAEARLDKALRATHHLLLEEAIEEIHVNPESLTITTDTGRTFEVARNTKYIA